MPRKWLNSNLIELSKSQPNSIKIHACIFVWNNFPNLVLLLLCLLMIPCWVFRNISKAKVIKLWKNWIAYDNHLWFFYLIYLKIDGGSTAFDLNNFTLTIEYICLFFVIAPYAFKEKDFFLDFGPLFGRLTEKCRVFFKKLKKKKICKIWQQGT